MTTGYVYLISSNTMKKRGLITEATLEYICKTSIEMAQKIGLRGIIGDCLIEKLQYLVSTKDEETGNLLINLPENINYRILLNNYITDFLVYRTMAEAVIPMRDKMRNAGVVNTTDTNYQQPDFNGEVTYVKRYWMDASEYFGTILRQYIEKHLEFYPEYTGCDTCGDKNGKLENTYHCGIVL